MPADTFSLAGKVAIITGSGRENGIGATIAKTFARNGAAVTINHVSDATAPRAERIAESIRAEGGRATVVGADVSTAAGAEKIVAETLKAFGVEKIDILVNNAGYGELHNTLDMPEAQIEKCFAVNMFGAIHMTRSAVPRMARGGRVINISTIAWKMGAGVCSMYCAAKAAVDTLSGCWAQEFGRSHGITVNSVAPGPVPTDINASYIDDVSKPFLPMTRAGDRLGTTEDIADIVLFVASEKSRWITGQFFSASGGVTIG